MTGPWPIGAPGEAPQPDPKIVGHGMEDDGYTTTAAVLSDGRLVQWVNLPGRAGAIDPVDLARHLEASTPPPSAAHRQIG